MLFLISLPITISIESCRQDLFFDGVDRFIFNNNQMKLFPWFSVIPQIGIGLPKTGVSFNCVIFFFRSYELSALIWYVAHGCLFRPKTCLNEKGLKLPWKDECINYCFSASFLGLNTGQNTASKHRVSQRKIHNVHITKIYTYVLFFTSSKQVKKNKQIRWLI